MSQTSWGEPTCAVQPVDPQEVKQVVQILTDQDVYFAIRFWKTFTVAACPQISKIES